MTRIYYDGQCPFCSRYVRLTRLCDAVGHVELVDVRTDAAARDELAGEGFDLDVGMVFQHNGRRYGGAEAVHRISLLSTQSDMFNRLNLAVMGSSVLCRLLYPFLRAGRAATLFAMGRSRINGERVPDTFRVFSHAWGIFTFLQLLYPQFYDVEAPMGVAAWTMGLLGAYLTARPASPRVFAGCLVASAVNAVQQMPTHSNHMILRDFALLGMLASSGVAWLRGRSWNQWFVTFVPVGRALLAVMYVFGVFHKLNADYLNPTVSCAVELWRQSPLMPQFLDTFKLAAIYGTLVVEGLILVGLLSHRFRHISVIAGIAFHSLIALSDYAFYTPFSALTVALHMLYLGPDAARAMTRSAFWSRLQSPAGLVGVAVWCGLVALVLDWRAVAVVGVLWLGWTLWLLKRLWRPEPASVGSVIAHPVMLNAVAALFCLNCLTPYFGLKTAQSMSMFANLVSEGPASNHLLFSGAPTGYLDDLVRPVQTNDAYLLSAQLNGLNLVYYDLLDRLDRHPTARVTFERNGRIYTDQTASTLHADIRRVLHPRWFRAWFVFKPVDLRRPKACSIM